MWGRPRLLRKCCCFFVLLSSYSAISYIFFVSDQALTNQVLPPDWAARMSRVQTVCLQSDTAGREAVPAVLGRRGLAEAVRERYRRIHQSDIVKYVVRIHSLGLDWCLVPKVASSSICRVLLPFLPTEPSHVKEPSLYPHIQEEVWARAGHLEGNNFSDKNFPAFLITRHPFARIASAYRNKLEDRHLSHDGEYFYKTYSKQVIRKARGSWSDSSPEPTFPEFVSWLLGEKVQNDDEHWMPVSLRCRMCQIQYRYILRYENIGQEWPNLLDSLELSESQRKRLQLPWENRGPDTKLKDYFSQISAETQSLLYTKLESDFLMFGYRMSDHF